MDSRDMQELCRLMQQVRKERQVFRTLVQDLPVPIVEEFEQVTAVAVAVAEVK